MWKQRKVVMGTIGLVIVGAMMALLGAVISRTSTDREKILHDEREKRESVSTSDPDGDVDISQMPRGAAFPHLPPGCRIVGTGATGKQWVVTARRLTFESPDGDVTIQFMEDGAVEVVSYKLQQVRFGAMGGIDKRARVEFGKEESDETQDLGRER